MADGSADGGRASSPKQRQLLTDSNLSDQDRRQVRYMQRELLQGMKEQEEELRSLNSDKFDAAAGDVDELYQHVHYPREGNLDSLCLDELETAVGKQSKMLSGTDMTKFKALDLINAGSRECTTASTEFDWDGLGVAVGSCFQSVPDTNVLFGRLDTTVAEKKQRKAPRRAPKDVTAQAAEPKLYTAKAKDTEGAQARRLKVLETAVARESGGKASLFNATLDPTSFEQTIENLFDTSFLVNQGVLGIGVDETTGLPYIEQTTAEHGDGAEREQSIISLTPAQWEELASAYGRDEPLVGHRS